MSITKTEKRKIASIIFFVFAFSLISPSVSEWMDSFFGAQYLLRFVVGMGILAIGAYFWKID